MNAWSRSTATDSFYPSPKSALARQRRLWWLALLLVLAGGYRLYQTQAMALLYSVAMPALLLTVVCLWRCMQRLQRSRPWLTLDRDGLYSPWLHGSRKHLRWQDIGRIRLDPQQRCLTFAAHARPGPRLDGLSKEDLDVIRMGQDRLPLPAPVTGHSLSLGALSRDDVALLQLALQRHQAGRDFRGQSDRFPPGQETVPPRTGVSTSLMLMLLFIVVWLFILVAAVGTGAGLDGSRPEQLLDWGASTGYDIQHGAWWRLFSAIMLHGSLPHLLMNMAGLCSMGILAERLYGPRRFLLLYLGSGLCGNALSLHFGAQSAISAGASGAIFGIAGALLMTMLLGTQPSDSLRKQKLSTLGLFVFYALLVGVTSKGVDNAAHIGGLLGGMLLAPILLPGQRFSVHPLLAGVATMAVVSALAVTAPQAPADMRYLITSQDIRERVDKQLERQTTLLQQDEEAARNGKLDKHAFDQRRRDIHAPVFARLHRELAAYPLSDDDPLYYRQKIKLRRLRLQGELLQIPLATAPSADMQNRASEIERELADLAVSERVMQAMETLRHHLYRRQTP